MNNQNEIEVIGFKSKKLIKAHVVYTTFFSLFLISFLIAEIFLYGNIFFSILYILVDIISVPMLIISAIKLLQAKDLPEELIKIDNANLYFWHKGKYEQIELKKIEKLNFISHFINHKGNSSISGDGILEIQTHHCCYKVDFIVCVYDLMHNINSKRYNKKSSQN